MLAGDDLDGRLADLNVRTALASWDALHQTDEAMRFLELADAHPKYPGLLYNVACCESLAGRRADALEHLRLAIERSERSRSLAAGDSDFDPIREDPAFKELVG